MRLTLDAADDLVVADDGSTVRGVAVPWDTVGRTSAGPVLFRRGALPAAVDPDAPIPLCLDHDTTRPIGVVAELVDDPDALRFVAALDPVPAAEHARAQMRTRSRPGVSVGVDLVEWVELDDGTLDVSAASWVELSSVVRPAFTAAQVAAAARKPVPPRADAHPTEGDTTMSDPAVVDAPATLPATLDPTPPRNVSVAPTLRAMAADVVARVRAADNADGRSLRAVIEQVEADAVRAALADITNTQVPPSGSWVRDLDNYVRRGMPTVEAFTVRPTDAWPVNNLQVKTAPVPGKQTAEKAAIPSNAAAFEWAKVEDDTYAWGADLSVQMIEDNGEQAVEELVEIAGEEVGKLIEADAIAAIAAAATAGPTTGLTLDNLGAAVGTVAGTGRVPSLLIAAPDTYGKAWALMQQGGPGIAGVTGGDERLRLVLGRTLPAGTAVVGARDAFRTYISRVSRLRAVEVSLLGVNVGVYRRAAFRVVDATALVKLTTTP